MVFYFLKDNIRKPIKLKPYFVFNFTLNKVKIAPLWIKSHQDNKFIR